ncbi:MAG: hypothetical protein ABW126_04180, partial [Candidatus Sedimenticola sp. 4PFRAG1]
ISSLLLMAMGRILLLPGTATLWLFVILGLWRRLLARLLHCLSPVQQLAHVLYFPANGKERIKSHRIALSSMAEPIMVAVSIQ